VRDYPHVEEPQEEPDDLGHHAEYHHDKQEAENGNKHVHYLATYSAPIRVPLYSSPQKGK